MISNREIGLLVVLAGVGALFWYSRTSGGASAFADLAGSVSGLFVNIGIRNCNPGNIERVPGIRWKNSFQTQAECEAAGRVWDSRFEVFYTMSDGVRAIGHDLCTAVNEGYSTIDSLVDHYAPAADGNNVDAYKSDVSTFMQKDVNEQISVAAELPLLTAAFMHHETGYSDDLSTIASEVFAS